MQPAGTWPTAPQSRRRPLLWPWVVTLVLGFAVAAAGAGIYVAVSVVPLFSHTGVPTPHTFRLQLSPGTYDVYQAPYANATFPAFELTPTDVQVVRAGTTVPLPTYTPSSVFSLSNNGTPYHGFVEFVVTRGGTYVVRVGNPGGLTSLVFVAPSLTSQLRHDLGYLALVGVGGVLVVLGAVTLLVRGIQRARRRRGPPPPFVARCANGHPTHPGDRFCAACGAPVLGTPPPVAPV